VFISSIVELQFGLVN